jgi:putative colanic acid biosynthesis acetyltransferase WcaF
MKVAFSAAKAASAVTNPLAAASAFPFPRPMRLQGYTVGGFDRGAPRWQEALWQLVRACFFMGVLPLPSEWRCELLRAFGAKVGSGVIIRSQVDISHPWRLTLGDHVWLGEEVKILSLAQVTIESNVCISQRAFLCTGSHDFRAPAFDLITKPILIRERSWIAAQVFIAPGITLGPDSMARAGSVVLADVPPKTIVQGNPASSV